MKFQLAKLYRGDHFSGFGIAVNGQLLDGLASVTINTEPCSIPTATVVFNLDRNTAENQVVINLEETQARFNFDGSPSHTVIHDIKKAATEGAKRGYHHAVNQIPGEN
ncbi:MAG: hypothetical protein ACRCV4_03840 [Hafnia alvei]